MDQSFRIALWMFFLIVYLQANPIPAENRKFNMDDLNLDLLEDVTCVSYVMINYFSSSLKISEFKIFVNAILDFVQLINTGN
uniref:Uncharacterized protein n=1 Tax=Sander lucioperca TaxID=283035 RepID=A0A8D0CW39_SANLU